LKLLYTSVGDATAAKIERFQIVQAFSGICPRALASWAQRLSGGG